MALTTDMDMMRANGWLGTVVAAALWAANFTGAGSLPRKAPGPYLPLEPKDHVVAPSFERAQPLVCASYFYWYDVDSKAHIIDGDGSDALTTHPADMNGISYRRAAWHRQQLLDMGEAGIDFLLPVYWGVPGKYDGWSFAGLAPLVEAHSALEREGLRPPAIGLFYDSSILQWNGFNTDGSSYHVDLATGFGKDWFYTAMRDFFSLIPPGKWARVNGRPVVFIYTAAFAKKQDPNQFAYVRERFKGDFGVEPFLVKSADWEGEADAVYSWGGAVNGPLIYRQVAALGPGYDHSAVPGRTALVVERRDGKTYIERWLKLLQLNPQQRPWMVHVETWNEWHEGTDVAHSREYGRSYIVLTRLFADLWHAKTRLRLGGSYPDANEVTWEPGQARGLEIRASSGDGVWEIVRFGQIKAAVPAANPHSQTSRYLYFNVDDAFGYELFEQTARVSIEYRDAGCGSLRLEYDSSDRQAGLFEGAFREAGVVVVNGTGKWMTAEFALPKCGFMNRCNGTDFRIAVLGGSLELPVAKAVLSKCK